MSRRLARGPTPIMAPQRVWDYYCERHRERYGEAFAPNVLPDWDR